MLQSPGKRIVNFSPTGRCLDHNINLTNRLLAKVPRLMMLKVEFYPKSGVCMCLQVLLKTDRYPFFIFSYHSTRAYLSVQPLNLLVEEASVSFLDKSGKFAIKIEKFRCNVAM